MNDLRLNVSILSSLSSSREDFDKINLAIFKKGRIFYDIEGINDSEVLKKAIDNIINIMSYSRYGEENQDDLRLRYSKEIHKKMLEIFLEKSV